MLNVTNAYNRIDVLYFFVLFFGNLCMNFVSDWNSLNCTDCDSLGKQEKLYPFGGFGHIPKLTKLVVFGHDSCDTKY